MIKKAFCLIMIVALIMGLYGCASSKASEYARNRGQIAVEITEDYITGNITADVARSKSHIEETVKKLQKAIK